MSEQHGVPGLVETVCVSWREGLCRRIKCGEKDRYRDGVEARCGCFRVFSDEITCEPRSEGNSVDGIMPPLKNSMSESLKLCMC